MVDWDGLENRCAARYRGFESHPLLQKPQGGFRISPCVAAQTGEQVRPYRHRYSHGLAQAKAVATCDKQGARSGVGERRRDRRRIDAEIGGAVADNADGALGIVQRNFGPRTQPSPGKRKNSTKAVKPHAASQRPIS